MSSGGTPLAAASWPFLALLMWTPQAARATAANLPDIAGPSGMFEQLIGDLDNGDGPDRRYALRALRHRVSSDLRRAERGAANPAGLEALLRLEDYDRQLAPICQSRLQERMLTAGCADILGMLGDAAALPAIEAALGVEGRPGALRHLSRAAATLRAGEEE